MEKQTKKTAASTSSEQRTTLVSNCKITYLYYQTSDKLYST